MEKIVVFCVLAAFAPVNGVSPVQKVVEMLDACKAKVQKDLDAEAKAMEEYTAFCDTELSEKGYAIKTATRELDELSADIVDQEAIISSAEDVIAQTGTEIAKKDKESYAANEQRRVKNEAFVAAEKEMLESVDELTRAANALKGGAGAAFLQASALPPRVRGEIDALKAIVDAGRMDSAGRKKLHSFLQAAEQAKENAEDSDLQAEAPKEGGILETVEDMQKKAEDGLSELRQNEMKDNQSFELVKQDLESRITNFKDKLSKSTKEKAEATEKLAQANADTVETKKSLAADQEYSTTLQTECEQTAIAWEARKKSAKEEMGAIEKAKEILVSGVKALVQVHAATRRSRDAVVSRDAADEAAAGEDAVRSRVVGILRGLSKRYRSYGLALIASASASDPFVKIRGLIEDMIAKLVKEAQEEATHEAFCQEEMGKSKASKEDKEASLEKHTVRIETLEASIAELTKKIKVLEAEIAEIDATQAKATKVRTQENEEYKVASADFRQSAEAVARAIEVLKNYYGDSSFVQVSGASAAPPKFGSAKGDAGGSIISILEMAQEDFTRLLAEAEEAEAMASEDYEKLTNENKVSRAAKESEAKAAASEVKSSKLALENSKEDASSVSAELDAVLAYLEKLKPECESKAMSYAERKAAREAEIEGLKQALDILSGQGV